jgi:hypothetical protein
MDNNRCSSSFCSRKQQAKRIISPPSFILKPGKLLGNFSFYEIEYLALSERPLKENTLKTFEALTA